MTTSALMLPSVIQFVGTDLENGTLQDLPVMKRSSTAARSSDLTAKPKNKAQSQHCHIQIA